MKTIDQYKPNQSFGLLLTGEPGTRKTTTALQFPAPYVADCDNNMSGIIRLIREKQKSTEKGWWTDKALAYDVINIDDAGKLVPEKDRWIRLLTCLTVALKDPKIETIVIDSLSAVNTYLTDYIIGQHVNKANTNMEIQDWGVFKRAMSALIMQVRSSGKMVVVTSHIKIEKDEVSGILKYMVNVQGSIGFEIAGMFSDWWACEVEGSGATSKYVVKAMPTPRMTLKNSLGLPHSFEFSWDAFAPMLAKGN